MKKYEKWFVYILKCSDNTLYTGITNNLEKRIDKHNAGTASKYTRTRIPLKLIYFEKTDDRSNASKRESEIKKLSRKQKESLIQTRLS